MGRQLLKLGGPGGPRCSERGEANHEAEVHSQAPRVRRGHSEAARAARAVTRGQTCREARHGEQGEERGQPKTGQGEAGRESPGVRAGGRELASRAGRWPGAAGAEPEMPGSWSRPSAGSQCFAGQQDTQGQSVSALGVSTLTTYCLHLSIFPSTGLLLPGVISCPFRSPPPPTFPSLQKPVCFLSYAPGAFHAARK